jgi:hypothetical protein
MAAVQPEPWIRALITTNNNNNLTIQSSRAHRHFEVQKLKSQFASEFHTICIEFRYNFVVLVLIFKLLFTVFRVTSTHILNGRMTH